TTCGTPTTAVGRCNSPFTTASSINTTARGLPAGTYYFAVEEQTTTPGTFSATVATLPPSPTYSHATAPASVTFLDACAAPGHINLLASVDDCTSAPQSIPFSFRYYGIPYSTLLPSADGYVVFGTGLNTCSYGMYMLPNA